jgi:hypothetical protein
MTSSERMKRWRSNPENRARERARRRERDGPKPLRLRLSPEELNARRAARNRARYQNSAAFRAARAAYARKRYATDPAYRAFTLEKAKQWAMKQKLLRQAAALARTP